VPMAYIPKAKRDIFISYPMEAEEWAQQFEQDLRKELEQWVPASELRTYLAKRDWQLSPSDEMVHEARQAAFFIAALVPGALSDDGLRFFQREWEAFTCSESVFGPVEGRFAPVLIKPIEARRIAQFFPLANANAFWRPFEFYFLDKTGIPQTLLHNSRKSIYCKKIAEVAWQIKQRLEQIKEQISDQGNYGTARTRATGPFSGMKVLLAEKDEQIGNEWHEVRQFLLNDGVELTSSGQYSQEDRKFEDQLTREIVAADLFIQLLNPLGEASSRVEAGTDQAAADVKTRAHRTYNCALAHLKIASRPFGILQWRDPKIMRGALRYWPEELLDSAHVQAVGLQQFKQAIRAKLEDLRRPPPPSPTSKPFLFIMADQPDLALARELSEVALDHADVDVLTETEQDRKEHFLEAMKIAAGVIILHGKAPVQFVNNWLSLYVREKSKLKRTSNLDALYRAPPPKRSDEEPRIPTRDLRSLGSEELVTLDGIRQLCEELDSAN
jgi:hypothetical protein